MRNNWIAIIIVLISICTFYSCKDNVANAGESTLSQQDEIRVKSDTFDVVSMLDSCAAISLTPDSFLLGECDTHFGTIKADILTQLACPEGFIYPGGETAVVDSVCLYLHYGNWYGDGKSPLGISVYEIDKQTLAENQKYQSDLLLSDFCSLDDSTQLVSSSKIIIPATPTDSSYYTETESYISTIRIKLSNNFAKRFFNIKDFSTQQAFNQLFKGLYICTDFGASNVLYIKDISMTVFYHFTMQRPTVEDSIIYDTRSFYVNKEVRQVNRYVYPNRKNILTEYTQVKDTNYVISPANIYTQLSISMDSIFNRIKTSLGEDTASYRVYVNRANLTVDVLYSDSVTGRPRDNWDSPAKHMMLIKEERLQSFFAKNELPSDTSAIVATLTYSSDSVGGSYYYTYDLSTLLTQQIRKKEVDKNLNFILVPVSVATNSSTGAITSIRQLQTISATRIRSANNSTKPMDIEMVYAGFNRTR